MKWYTLEERPIKEGDQGLFYTGIFYYCLYEKGEYDDGIQLWPQVDIHCCRKEIDYVSLHKVIYWIPLEELLLSVANKSYLDVKIASKNFLSEIRKLDEELEKE